MLLDNYNYETVRADELRSGDYIWYLNRPCPIIDVRTNEQTTTFDTIASGDMYGTAAFNRPNDEPQIRILNPEALF